MEDTSLLELCVEEDVVQSLCTASDSSTLEESLEKLIEVSKTEDGRASLASKHIVAIVIKLVQSLPYPSGREFVVSSFRLLRNLCAGEVVSQSLFVESNGIGAVLSVFKSARLCSEVDFGIIRVGLQVLANVSLGGEECRRAIWSQLFPQEFLALAKIRSREVVDPLCMVVYTCGDGNPGLPIAREIVRTVATVSFGEDWFKLLLSRMCLEEPHFRSLFSDLSVVGSAKVDNNGIRDGMFASEQAFLLRMVSEVLNERIEERDFSVTNEFASSVFEIFKSSIKFIDSGTRTKSGLPTGSTEIDVLGYSLTILRDICARESPIDSNEECMVAVETLISSGLVELLLSLLHDFEPPVIIRKSMMQGEKNGEQEGTSSSSSKPCPYKGFRRDLIAVIGNCAFGRKHVQDNIRQRDGILLLLQQCVTDEENPFLREWGIWSVRNLLQGNAENQQAVAELELQGSVDTPELAGLGLKVEVDTNSGRAKLVNVSALTQKPAN